MLRNVFSATQEVDEDSVMKKLVMGLMLGMAIGWVLLRYRHKDENGVRREQSSGSHEDEIEITETLLAEDEQEPTAEESDTPNKEASTAPETIKTSSQTDRLEAIKGIGPVFAKRLRAAGINSYRALSNTPPETLREIVSAQPWQAVEAEDWITQARELSKTAS
jgi:predicted flap endonuclease-1-like 5' DNA nuclease